MKPKTESQMPLPGIQPAQDPVASNEPLTKRLLAATRPAMIQVAPGKYAPFRKGANPPAVSLCTWAQNDDGTFSPLPFTERLVRLDTQVAAQLGFEGHQRNTLRRLGEAGFIDLIKITPGCTLLNLDSYYNHLRRCAENPDFWNRDGKNFRVYLTCLRRDA